MADQRREITVKRRKKRVVGCANPLFVQWVEELRDEAKERKLKSHYSYTKAINSLRKYPLPLKSGEEAKILGNVGDKLAKMLDRRLAEYNSNKGSNENFCDRLLPAPQKASSSAKGTRKRAEWRRDEGSDTGTSSPPSKISSSPIGSRKNSKQKKDEGSDTGATPLLPPLKRKKSVMREYVPEYRSGPYALIIALHNAKEKASWRGFLHKAELIADAQPLSEKSFTVPDAGSYYTAWSSMSSIIRRGLVKKISHPPRFSLTDKGEVMAQMLLKGDMATAAPTQSQPTSPPSSNQEKNDYKSDKRKDTNCSNDLTMPSSLDNQNQKEIIFSSCKPVHYVDSLPSSVPSDFTEVYSLEDSYEQDPNSQSSSNMDSNTALSVTPLSFWYVDHSGNTVLEKDKASVTFNDILSVGFLIKCKQKELEAAKIVYNIDNYRKADGPFVYAYIDNLDAPETSNPPTLESKIQEAPSHRTLESKIQEAPSYRTLDFDIVRIQETPVNNVLMSESLSKKEFIDKKYYKSSSDSDDVIVLDDSEDEIEVQPLSNRVGFSPTKLCCSGEKTAVFKASGDVEMTSDQRKEEIVQKKSLNTSQSTGLSSIRSSAKIASPIAPGPSKLHSGSSYCVENSVSCSPLTSTATGSEPQVSRSTNISHGVCSERDKAMLPVRNESIFNLGNPEFVLTPGNFEVVLIVDSSESSASRKSTSQFRGILLQELGKNGVMFDVRRLNIGDFTWIAREKSVPKPGSLMLPKSREVILEYIVERKRMDDLAGSIIDGRFKEQKFRLKNSGVLHPVYLVEEHGDPSHLRIDLWRLNQAIANTQIIDKFFVKRTSDIRESVAYLTIMTRSLQLFYAGKSIRAYPWDVIAEFNKTRPSKYDMASEVVNAIEFNKFNEASMKNKSLTVHEMFGRHLIQLPGLSAEKAAVILKHYPTLSHLREAYSSCANEADKVKLMENLRSGPSNRRFGSKLSQLICSLYSKGDELCII